MFNAVSCANNRRTIDLGRSIAYTYYVISETVKFCCGHTSTLNYIIITENSTRYTLERTRGSAQFILRTCANYNGRKTLRIRTIPKYQ